MAEVGEENGGDGSSGRDGAGARAVHVDQLCATLQCGDGSDEGAHDITPKGRTTHTSHDLGETVRYSHGDDGSGSDDDAEAAMDGDADAPAYDNRSAAQATVRYGSDDVVMDSSDDDRVQNGRDATDEARRGCGGCVDGDVGGAGGGEMDGLGVNSMAWARCSEGSASSLAHNEASALGLAATATRSAVLLSGPVLVPHGTAVKVSQSLCVA